VPTIGNLSPRVTSAASLGLICVILAIGLFIRSRFPESCATTVSREEPSIVFVVNSANHDCTYSIAVGNEFALDVPVADVKCGFDWCWDTKLKLSSASLVGNYHVDHSNDTPAGLRRFIFPALATGKLVLDPYRITVNIVR